MMPWFFVYVADMQPGSPRSFRFNPAWAENWATARRQIRDLGPEFILIGGDVTRDGSIHDFELEAMKADFDGMGLPYHVIPGNMDTGNKHTRIQGARDNRDDVGLNISSEHIRRFEAVFGPTKWSFVHENVRVSGFCDMLLGSGLPEEDELLDWFEERKAAVRCEHHLWLMHYPLFIDRLDEPPFDIADPAHYLDWYFCVDQGSRKRLMDLFHATGATRVITGHVHCRKDHAAEGICFDLAPATCSGQWADRWPDGDPALGFFRYDVDDAGLRKTFIPLARVSTRDDAYGPGGHPKPEARDYSLAWEK
ncbi:MAG: metallophosphoesterase [Candidatus Hydrogenedentes bacterium]|nr:metallophosphoesterase [Candidatus Hydrogenedentota bacterium]